MYSIEYILFYKSNSKIDARRCAVLPCVNGVEYDLFTQLTMDYAVK